MSIEAGATLERPSRQEANGGDAAEFALLTSVDRLEQIVERETQALRKNEPIDFEDYSSRKTRAHLEFTRALRAFPPRSSGAVERKLSSLRATLAENASMLECHLRAMNEIADMMVHVIEASEWDGTYSARHKSNP